MFEQDSFQLPPIWPSTDVTPDQLGTANWGGVNPIDGMTPFLR